MKRSIPPRASMSEFNMAQLMALVQIQAREAEDGHEQTLLYLDSVLNATDRLEAAKLLRRLSENARSADLWHLFGSIASDIEKGKSLVEVLRLAQNYYNLVKTQDSEKPRTDRGQK
jgi:hypothetical protein